MEPDGFLEGVSLFVRNFRASKTDLPESFSTEFITNLESSVHLLLAEIHKSLNNIELAVQHYRLALQHNLFCVEAFEALTTGNLLPATKSNLTKCYHLIAFMNFPSEAEIMTTIRQQCAGNDSGRSFAYLLYSHMSSSTANISISNSPEETSAMALLHDHFTDDADLICVKAESLYQKLDYSGARRLLEPCVRRNPHNNRALLIFVAVLYSIGDYNELFRLGSILAENEPGSAICL